MLRKQCYLLLILLFTGQSVLQVHGQSAADSSSNRKTRSGGSAACPTKTAELQVWLYSLLAADYDGAALLPHFVDHYLKLGFVKEHMLFLVNSNPARPDVPNGSLEGLMSKLISYQLDFRVWRGQYSAEAHLKHKLQLLQRVPVQDWIVLVDSDEFHEYPAGASANAFLQRVDAQGGSWVKGHFIDRVAADGRLRSVQPRPAIWQQYPLQCDIAHGIAHGEAVKVAAFKGYLRSGVGNHGIIHPTAARHYFGPAEVGQESARYGLCGAENLYPFTPYAIWHSCYRLSKGQHSPQLWDAQEATLDVRVHHFKWHEGVQRSVRDRLEHYRGDDEACAPGQPRFKFWRESERLMKGITTKGVVNVTARELKCMQAANPRFAV